MDCEQITQTSKAVEILKTAENKHLKEKLFDCIYSMYQASFLKWIAGKYGSSRLEDKLWEDAKDAFQNGLCVFYEKAQHESFAIKSSLKTTIYSFGLLQLLAHFKKDRSEYGTGD